MSGGERSRITRRQFLAGGGAVALSAVLLGREHEMGRLLAELGGDGARPGEVAGAVRVAAPAGAGTESVPLPSFTFSVARDADLALLDFSFYSFEKVVVSGVTMLSPTGSGNVIVVQFPPQSIGEAAYNYESTAAHWDVDPPPVLSAVSGPSRLCFTLPAGRAVSFPTMTAADLLDWTDWELLVPISAMLPATSILSADESVAPLAAPGPGEPLAAARPGEPLAGPGRGEPLAAPGPGGPLAAPAPGATGGDVERPGSGAYLVSASARPMTAAFKPAVPSDPRGSLTTYIEYPYGLLIAPAVHAPSSSPLPPTLSIATGVSAAPFAGRTTPLQSPDGVADCWGASLALASASSPAPGVAVYALDYDAPGENLTPETYIIY
ncbi:MAG TPA: hypothetical protein VMD59_22960 [Acidimicrobiales bacterium]|nr:hypothetical protein [Acidimicrobiales bacterium]